MAARKVNVGLATYRRADMPDLNGVGMYGEEVDVHDDDVERFDRLNGGAPAAPVAPEEAADDRPAGNASLDEWRAYALANGKTDADLDGLSRNEVRGLFA